MWNFKICSDQKRYQSEIYDSSSEFSSDDSDELGEDVFNKIGTGSAQRVFMILAPLRLQRTKCTAVSSSTPNETIRSLSLTKMPPKVRRVLSSVKSSVYIPTSRLLSIYTIELHEKSLIWYFVPINSLTLVTESITDFIVFMENFYLLV